MSSEMTPEERARALLAAQPPRKSEITLRHNGDHGVEYYVCPWPDQAGRMHTTFLVKGDRTMTGYIVPGGKQIRVTMNKSSEVHNLIREIRSRRADKLTNPSNAAALSQFEIFLLEMLKTISSSQQVSLVILRAALVTCAY